jgi:hypothetical protein
MPSGIIPKVNAAHEFLQIADNFQTPLEIFREALSNSWDAGAEEVKIKIEIDRRTPRYPTITIIDDGNGMDEKRISDFFGLGYSNKPTNAIGSKGHGTKIYYKSEGIHVETISKDYKTKIIANTEKPPYDELEEGRIPTYQYEKEDAPNSKSKTSIKITRFQARPLIIFKKVEDEIVPYIKWYTICGSFEHYFNKNARKMQIVIENIDENETKTIDSWFRLPENNLNAQKTEDMCKIFSPKTLEAHDAEKNTDLKINILGCLLGASQRSKLGIAGREEMGVWFCKDFIKIEKNLNMQSLFAPQGKSGTFYVENFLILVNCQEFTLSANRETIQRDGIYNTVEDKVREYIKEIRDDEFSINFFERRKNEERLEEEAKKQSEYKKNDEKLREYNQRPDFPKELGIIGAPIKIPQNEKEVLLLLQSLISNKHSAIDFVIGCYDDHFGTDSIIEFDDKGVHRQGWLELLYHLSNLLGWYHYLDRIHKIVCWDIGDIKPGKLKSNYLTGEIEYIKNGKDHQIKYNNEYIKVYVLKELLNL